jgi:hypothetical protein
MEGHLQAVGFIYKTLGIIWLALTVLIGSVVAVVLLFFGSALALAYGAEACPVGADVPLGLMAVVLVVIAGFFTAYSVAAITAGIAFPKRRPWARPLVVVLSIVTLFLNIPFGLAIGIYSLWVCFSSKTAKLFEEASS